MELKYVRLVVSPIARVLSRVIVVLAVTFCAVSALASIRGSNAYPELDEPLPQYLQPFFDGFYRTMLIRVSGDPGTSIVTASGTVLGTWGSQVRPIYSLQEAWSVDGKYLFLYNPLGNPAFVILDGHAYKPVMAGCDFLWDFRWSPKDGSTMISVNEAGTELRLVNIKTCAITKSITIPGSTYGIGSGQGNVSNDGNYVAISNGNTVYVVNISTGQVGPSVDTSSCHTSGCTGHVTMSPSGNYMIVSQDDYQQVYRVNKTTLALTPLNYPKGSFGCSVGPQSAGFLDARLGHADFTFSGNTEIIVGQGECPLPGTPLPDGRVSGHVLKVNLANDALSTLTAPVSPTDGSAEAYADHISARNVNAPGTVTVGYYKQDSTNGYTSPYHYSEEILSLSVDGKESVRRYTPHHSTQVIYESEPHASPNWDNTKFIFGSDWASHCGTGPCGSTSNVYSFVILPHKRTRDGDHDHDDK